MHTCFCVSKSWALALNMISLCVCVLIAASTDVDQLLYMCIVRRCLQVAGGASDLRKVAMKVLSKTSSASACERNWSAFAAVQTPKRNRLASKTLNNLVFLRVNLRLQQKLKDPNYAETVADWIETTAVQSDADSEDDDTETATPPTAAHAAAATVAPVVDVQVIE